MTDTTGADDTAPDETPDEPDTEAVPDQELEEPSTETEPGEEPRSAEPDDAEPDQAEPDHRAVGLGVDEPEPPAT